MTRDSPGLHDPETEASAFVKRTLCWQTSPMYMGGHAASARPRSSALAAPVFLGIEFATRGTDVVKQNHDGRPLGLGGTTG